MAQIDFNKNWLNRYGQVCLINRTNHNIVAERSYHWVNRVTIIDETHDRSVIGDKQISDFDDAEWSIVTVRENEYIKSKISEVVQIRRNLNIGDLLS
jgi:hypothetical protein